MKQLSQVAAWGDTRRFPVIPRWTFPVSLLSYAFSFYIKAHDMSSELKCLRCSSEMELGSLSHREQLYPTVWLMRQAQEPAKFGIRRISKEEAARIKAERAEVLQRRTYVDAYRCPKCGHIELSATRKVATDNKRP